MAARTNDLTKAQSKVWIMFYVKPRKRYEFQKLFRYRNIYDISKKLLNKGYIIDSEDGICIGTPNPVIQEIKDRLKEIDENLTPEEERVLYGIFETKEMRETIGAFIEKADVWDNRDTNWVSGFTYLFIALFTSAYCFLKMQITDYEDFRKKILRVNKLEIKNHTKDVWQELEKPSRISLNVGELNLSHMLKELKKELNLSHMLKNLARIPEPLIGKLMKIRVEEIEGPQATFFEGWKLKAQE